MVRKTLWFLAIACVYAVAMGQTALAGPPPVAPEIDPAAGGSAISLVAGVLAMIEQRRRRATLVA
jgi:hypothetical protein